MKLQKTAMVQAWGEGTDRVVKHVEGRVWCHGNKVRWAQEPSIHTLPGIRKAFLFTAFSRAEISP